MGVAQKGRTDMDENEMRQELEALRMENEKLKRKVNAGGALMTPDEYEVYKKQIIEKIKAERTGGHADAHRITKTIWG